MILSAFQQVMSVLLHRNVQTMDLFLLPRSLRSKVVSLLVSAVKIDREENEVSLQLMVGFFQGTIRLTICNPVSGEERGVGFNVKQH